MSEFSWPTESLCRSSAEEEVLMAFEFKLLLFKCERASFNSSLFMRYGFSEVVLNGTGGGTWISEATCSPVGGDTLYD